MITKQDVFINYKIYLFIICEKKYKKTSYHFLVYSSTISMHERCELKQSDNLMKVSQTIVLWMDCSLLLDDTFYDMKSD